MIIRRIVFFISLAFSAVVSAQEVNVSEIDSFISHIESNNRAIGSISIFQSGQEVYNRSFGQKELENVEFDANTKYQIGSITKMLTATLILDLIESKELNMDDVLAEYYPEVPYADKIRILNLLEHSSGLGDFSMKDESGVWLTSPVDESKIMEEIIKQGVSFEPGEDMEYSNSGYFLLRKILEKVTEKSYAELVEEKIAGPLGLEHLESITDSTKNTFYSYSFDYKWKEIKDFYFSNIIGVGDMVSTTNNLNAFMYDLFHYKVLDKELVDVMKPDTDKNEVFGRGLMLIPFYDHIFYGHGGNTYGTHSFVAYNELDELGISISINGERYPHNNVAIGILSTIYDKDFEFPVFEVFSLTPEELEAYVGTYTSPDFPLDLTIRKEGGQLKGQGTGQPEFQLECYGKDKFKFERAGLKLEFFPEEDRMLLNQGGMEVEMMRE